MGPTMTDLQGGQSTADAELRELAPWFHNLHLPDGRQTAPDHPLGDFPALRWRHLGAAIDRDLHGQTVLDIGCNAGFHSFELARRGAQVVAIDHDPHYLRQARWACDRFGLGDHVQFRQLSVYRLHELRQQFDLVLFLGVLCHLRHPLLALDLVRECTRGLLLFQSLSLPEEEACEPPLDLPPAALPLLLQPGWPRVAFVEHAYAGDQTNWWVPNRAALEAMLRSSGFTRLRRLPTNSWLCAADSGRGEATARRRQELEAATGVSRD